MALVLILFLWKVSSGVSIGESLVTWKFEADCLCKCSLFQKVCIEPTLFGQTGCFDVLLPPLALTLIKEPQKEHKAISYNTSRIKILPVIL